MKAKILEKEYAQGTLTNEDLQFLKDNPDIATERAKKDIQFLKKKNKNALEESVRAFSKSKKVASINIDLAKVAAATPISVTLGTDKSMTSFTDHDYGSSDSGLGDGSAKADYSSKYADALVTTGDYGDGEGWGWIGTRVNVSSSGSSTSKQAYIRFSGKYKGSMVGGVGGSAETIISVKVFDVTAGSWLDDITVTNPISENNIAKYPSGNISHSANVTLQAGHQYLFMQHIESYASQYGAQISNNDF